MGQRATSAKRKVMAVTPAAVSAEPSFERIVDCWPAFDKRDTGHGIGSMRIRFVLRGPLGAVQFMIGTDWGLPSVQQERPTFSTRDAIRPSGWDVGYHSPKPLYEGQSSVGACDLLGCDCYYDGSGLRADQWVKEFLAGGTEWLWPKLETEYRSLFCEPTAAST